MYAMVLSIFAATFLLLVGALFLAGSAAFGREVLHRGASADEMAKFMLCMMFPLGSIFLVAGLAQLAGTIRQLRGTTARATTTERAFRLLNTDFATGKTYEDRYR